MTALRKPKVVMADPKATVRDECLTLFQETFGFAWDEKWARLVRAPENLAEARARKAHAALRKAMLDAETAARSNGYGSTLSMLRWWVPQFVSPLLQHVYMEPRESHQKRRRDDGSRGDFVSIWDFRNIMNLPFRKDGTYRALNAREFAIISLLAGNWPTVSAAATVKQIIRAEEKAMRSAISRYGYRPTEGTKIRRGP